MLAFGRPSYPSSPFGRTTFRAQSDQAAPNLYGPRTRYLELINLTGIVWASGHSHPPKPPVLGRTLLGRSQLSAAPDLLPQCKKRFLVTNVTETQAALARGKDIGNGNGRAPD